jgi:hypothetical protein
MQICPQKQPPQFAAHRTECWLQDPSLSDAERAPLEREEVAVADEA